MISRSKRSVRMTFTRTPDAVFFGIWDTDNFSWSERLLDAFDIDEGLGNGYKIDYEYYLKGNLFGKINQLFDLKPKELEKEIMTDNMINILNKGGNICQEKPQKS